MKEIENLRQNMNWYREKPYQGRTHTQSFISVSPSGVCHRHKSTVGYYNLIACHSDMAVGNISAGDTRQGHTPPALFFSCLSAFNYPS